MTVLPLANGFYQSESLPISNQECVNLYPVAQQAPALNQDNLFGTPGVEELTSTGVVLQANRGAHTKNDIAYFVNGGALYSLDRTFDVEGSPLFGTTLLGVIEGTGRVSIANNTTQLLILVPGGKGYVYNENDATPFQEITDLDFRANGNPMYVVSIDNFFVFTTDTNKIIRSDLNDGLSYDALAFGSAESDPDATVAPVTANNQLWITGTVTTEGFQNIGGVGFNFQRNNVFLDKGCIAPLSLIKANQAFFMIGNGNNESPSVWQYDGTSFQKISTIAIDAALRSYTDEEIKAVFGMYYANKGEFFLIYTLPDTSFVYDLVTKKWHERRSLISDELTAWRVNSIITAYGKVIVGDSEDGRIGELSDKFYSEYSENIISSFSLQPFSSLKPFNIPYLELTMESGVGNSVSEDPQVSLEISNNGKIFGDPRNRSIGRAGEFNKLIIWRRNGKARRLLVLRFTVADCVKKVFAKLEAL